MLNHCHFITKNIKNSSFGFSVILLINNKIAAFTQGFKDDINKEYIIPRLSINEEFKFYSPGYILISEMIKLFDCEDSIKKIDLAMGKEKYKFDLGGEIHKSFNFVLK